jgi:DNA-binding beta-propeller fold protein YncE
MKRLPIALIITAAFAAGIAVPSAKTAQKHYVVTNDDVSVNLSPGPNSVTFYTASDPSSPKLTLLKSLLTGGDGVGNGTYAQVKQSLAPDGKDECIYAADAGSNDVAGIIGNTQTVAGNFKGSTTDNSADGMGVTLNPNGKYLYASFTSSNTIATFSVGSGCTLTFVADTSAIGLGGGVPYTLAARGTILVVAYADGSIESFNTSSGTPVSNGDEQFTSGVTQEAYADGIDITSDGHYAIFGDAVNGTTTVEVSNISTGKLTATIVYGGRSGGFGAGLNSNNVWLSPDESMLYVSNNNSGQVTGLFFNKTSGVITYGCTSSALKGFNSSWFDTTGLATALTSGTGKVLWVGEEGNGFAPPSSIGILSVASSNGSCTLTESANSPASDPSSPSLRSLSAFPSRPF